MKKNKPKIAVTILRFILASIVILVGTGFFLDIKNEAGEKEKDALFMIDQRLSSLFFEINSFPSGPGQEVVFLSQLASLKRHISNETNDATREGLAKDLESYLEQSQAYHSIQFIDFDSGERVYGTRAESGDYEDIRHYFDNHEYKLIVASLKEKSVYISPLHRHQENGKIFTALYYLTPVFDEFGKRRGAMVLVIDADYFLEDIRRYSKDEESVYLIDNHGFYLAHNDRDKEFLESQDGLGSFVNDYPGIGEKILSSEERRLENDEYVFSLRHIRPTAASFELYEGSQVVQDDDYYWVLVGVYKKQPVKSELSSFFSGDFIAGHLVMFVLILTLSILGIVCTKLIGIKNCD